MPLGGQQGGRVKKSEFIFEYLEFISWSTLSDIILGQRPSKRRNNKITVTETISDIFKSVMSFFLMIP